MVKRMIKEIELRAFGVCDWWGEKLNIDTNSIRVYFIYPVIFNPGFPHWLYIW